MLTATDSTGTSFACDAVGRVTQASYPGGQIVCFAYDSVGRRSRLSDNRGYHVRYRYDAAGRLVELRNSSKAMILRFVCETAGRVRRPSAGASNVFDFNRDGVVDMTDVQIVSSNVTAGSTVLRLLMVPLTSNLSQRPETVADDVLSIDGDVIVGDRPRRLL